jgi:hypothetical protein
MPLSSRYDDPILEQLARDAFALFPHCLRCGVAIDRFEEADLRIHVQRVVHRDRCPLRSLEIGLPTSASNG